MFYKLSEKQINEIIKKGIFDEREYLDDLIIVSYTTKDVIDVLDEETDKMLNYISPEELYQRLVNEISIEDNTDQLVCEDMIESFYNMRDNILMDQE